MDSYIVLFSSKCCDSYPNNTESQFRNRLCMPMILPCEMEIGLVQFSFHNAFDNIAVRETFQFFDFLYENSDKTYGKMYDISIEAGDYPGPEYLARSINEQIWKKVPRLKDKEVIRYDTIQNRFWFVFNKNDYFLLVLKEQLLVLFGVVETFVPSTQVVLGMSKERDSYTYNGEIRRFSNHEVLTSRVQHEDMFEFPPKLDDFSTMFIFTNIISEQNTGDELTNLLGITSIKEKTLSRCVLQTFDNPHYVPLRTTHIEHIEVQIRNEFGDLTRFQKGVSTFLKFHIRKKVYP